MSVRNRIMQELQTLNAEPGLREAFERIWVEGKERNRFALEDSKNLPPSIFHATDANGIPVQISHGQLPVPETYPEEDDVTDPMVSRETDPKGRVQYPEISFADIWDILYEAQIQHPRVAAVREMEALGDGLRMVRPRCSGQRLNVWAEGKELRQKVKVFENICAVLAAAHGHGVTHRELSPQQIWVEEKGAVWIDGWHRTQGKIQGNPIFVSPEVARGGSGSPRSDIYSLGLILRWLLYGQQPPHGNDMATTIALKFRAVPLPEDTIIPTALRQLCQESLALDPNTRPADARLLYARFLATSRRLL